MAKPIFPHPFGHIVLCQSCTRTMVRGMGTLFAPRLWPWFALCHLTGGIPLFCSFELLSHCQPPHWYAGAWFLRMFITSLQPKITAYMLDKEF